MRLALASLILCSCLGLSDGEEDQEPSEPQPAASETPDECELGTKRCDGATRQACLPDGWTRLEECESAELCQPEHCN
jgi:hypothetical protein